MKSLENTVPYLSASAVVIHYEEALYQVYAPYLYLTSKCGRDRQDQIPRDIEWNLCVYQVILTCQRLVGL